MKKVLVKATFVITIILAILFQVSSYATEKSDKKSNVKISEGIYKIILADSPEKSVTIENESSSNGANVCIQKYNNNVNQLFKIKYDKEGYCEIIPVNSGKRIDVAGWGNGVNIEQWGENNTSDSQQFTISKNEDETYNIIGKRQNLYLTADETSSENKINLVGNEKDEKKSQKFKLEKIETPENGRYKIVLANSRTQSVSVKNGKIGNAVGIELNTYQNTVKQQYELRYDNEGYC